MLQTVLCGAACAAAAYLLGSLSFSIIVTRLLYHKDIRTFGSGNAGMTNVLRTFVFAPIDIRVANAKVRPDAKDMPDRLWETHLAKHDRARASYYNYYTENRWGEAKNYDLCLNAAIGQDACAQLIVQAAKAMEAANQE